MNNYLLAFLWSIPGLLVATTMHEFVRALASSAMGDNLPKSQGRLTLNPLKHFEPIGFLLLFYTGGFGWGKPGKPVDSTTKTENGTLCWLPFCLQW